MFDEFCVIKIQRSIEHSNVISTGVGIAPLGQMGENLLLITRAQRTAISGIEERRRNK